MSPNPIFMAALPNFVRVTDRHSFLMIDILGLCTSYNAHLPVPFSGQGMICKVVIILLRILFLIVGLTMRV